jgi:hypothetical protein
MSTGNESKGRIRLSRVPSRDTLQPVHVPWVPERFDVERKSEPQESVEPVQVFEVSGADIDLTPPPSTTVSSPSTWTLPPWPPSVPDSILADPIPCCLQCNEQTVIPGQPGRSEGLCYRCWIKIQRGTK